jgi:hypothetical protein
MFSRFRQSVSIYSPGKWIVRFHAMLALSQSCPGDEAQRTAFVDHRTKFDGLVAKTKDQTALDKLCTGYQAALDRLLESGTNGDSILASSIKSEKERTTDLQKRFLTAPRDFPRLLLDRKWPECREYKVAVADFRTVLSLKAPSPKDRPDLDWSSLRSSKVLGQPVLTPMAEFTAKVQGVKGVKPATAGFDVGMSGFPKASFEYHGFDGEFTAKEVPGLLLGVTFKRMYVVTDRLKQVVAVQFTCEDPPAKKKVGGVSELTIFNFVQFRRKGVPNSNVFFDTREAPGGGTAIHTCLRVEGKTKEINSLFLSDMAKALVDYSLNLDGSTGK